MIDHNPQKIINILLFVLIQSKKHPSGFLSFVVLLDYIYAVYAMCYLYSLLKHLICHWFS